MKIFSPRSDDRHLITKVKFVNNGREKLTASSQWLNERDLHVRAQQGNWNSRKTSATTNIGNPQPLRDQLSNSGTVEDVSLPQSQSLPWPDESLGHAITCQYIDISFYI